VISGIEAKNAVHHTSGAKESNGAESSATTARTNYMLPILAHRYFGRAK
jgi:hypothetical protein